MATICKCDKCNKTVTSKNSIRMHLSDMFGVLGNKMMIVDVEFCEKCAKESAGHIYKIFPNAKVKSK